MRDLEQGSFAVGPAQAGALLLRNTRKTELRRRGLFVFLQHWWPAAGPFALLISFATAIHASPDNCAPCHRAETKAFAAGGMTRALESTTQAAILKANPNIKAEK